MLNEELTAIELLIKSGDHRAARDMSVAVANAHPDNVSAQLAAAYSCDRLGFEYESYTYYCAASKLVIPSSERPRYLLGFGSTLRSIGKFDEAIKCLKAASKEYPDHVEFLAFLALAYHSSGQHSIALAAMLDAALIASREGAFGTYGRALREYRDELIGSKETS